MKFLKIFTALTILFCASIFAVNTVDSTPSEDLKTFNKYKNQKTNTNLVTVSTLYTTVADKEVIKKFNKEIQRAGLDCFAASTCSNQKSADAADKVPAVLQKHKKILSNFEQMMETKKGFTVSGDVFLSDGLFFTAGSLITLELLQINLLYAEQKYKEAFKKALTLDRFIYNSLSNPNLVITTKVLLRKMKWLRESLQKFSPDKVELKKLDPEKIIEQTQIGEFFVFSNQIQKTLEAPFAKKIKYAREFPYTLFIVKNRTLNLYLSLAKKYKDAPCLKDEKMRSCKEIKINHMSLINPGGKMAASLFTVSPSNYKSIITRANAINSIDL